MAGKIRSLIVVVLMVAAVAGLLLLARQAPPPGCPAEVANANAIEPASDTPHGRVAHVRQVDDPGKPLDKHTYELSYDERGHLTEVRDSEQMDGKPETDVDTYYYDSHGNLVSSSYLCPMSGRPDKTRYTFDPRTHIATATTYESKRREPGLKAWLLTIRDQFRRKRTRPTDVCNYTLDRHNRITRVGWLDERGKTYRWSDYTRDSRGYPLSEVTTERGGYTSSNVAYVCDRWGNVVEQKDRMPGHLEWKRISYEYDARGNWVKRTTLNHFGKGRKGGWQLEGVSERLITYR